MSDLTLDGSIPGLPRHATPVRRKSDGWVGVVMSVHPGTSEARVAWNLGPPTVEALDAIGVRLGEPTGRAHAAWWVLESGIVIIDANGRLVRAAVQNHHMYAEEIEALRTLVIRLSGI